MEQNSIGAFLAALRKANGLTQRQLADKLCVSDKAVSRWERDEALPDLTLIPVIAQISDITSDELLRGQRFTESASSAHKTMFLYGEIVFGIITLLIAACLPLVLLPIGTFMGLSAGYIVACSKMRRYYCNNRPSE